VSLDIVGFGKREIRKAPKGGKNPPGAFILASSGKSIS
jgi:hypothetical protein